MAITLNDILTPGAKATGMPRPSVAPMDVSLTGSTGSANASVGKGQPMASQGQAVNAVAQTSQSQATTPATPTQQPQAQGSAGHTVETVKESTETTGSPQVEERPKSLSYAELLDKLWPNKPKTDEELEQERKKQKRTSIFAAISDGISALSNLYFTSQYAPDAFDPSKGMTATTKARFDKLKKDYENNQRQYLSAYMQAAKMDADSADKDRSWRHMLEREIVTDRYKEAADTRAQAKADRDASMAELRMELMQGKINQQEAAVEAKRIEAEYADAYWQSRIDKNNYRRPIGSGKKAEYPWYDSEGNLHYANSYEAMRQNAINNGTWSDATQESSSTRTTTDRRGNTKGTSSTTTTKPAKGHSEKPQRKKPNPMGDVSNSDGKQKKKNPMS